MTDIRNRIILWKPVAEPIEVFNRHTKQEMSGMVVSHWYHGQLINWAPGTSPIVPIKRLYPSDNNEWVIKERRKTWLNKYRCDKRARLRALLSAERGYPV